MKSWLNTLAVASLAGLAAAPLHAQTALAVVAQAAAPAPAMADGEVRKVDREAGKLTLRHGEIRHLDMPPMTMVFAVRDKALLDALKPGDKVRFIAVQDGGSYTVTALQPVR